MFLASSVKAEDGPILSKELRHIFYPSFVENNGSLPAVASNPTQPYMAGYMTTDYLSGSPIEDRATAVRVTVSLKGTDNSIIQDGNALGAGIAAQGPSSSGEPWPFGEPWIDYGYTMLLLVDNQYDWPFIQVICWEVVEWGPNNLWPLEWPVVDIVDYFTWEYPSVLTMDSEVTLIMKWDSNPDVLSYSAIIDDYPEYPLYTLIPNDIQLHYFMLGTVERENQFWEPMVDLPCTVKFFQFPGAWSNVNIGRVGWHSYLSYPAFIRTGESSWTNVTFAYSVNGTTSWLDNTVNWGGACYDNVNADYTYQHVHFYPTSDGATLEPDTLLWASHTLSISATSGGTTDPTPGTYTYGYGSSVTVTAVPDPGYFFNYWILDGEKLRGYGNPLEVTMRSDRTLKACFNKPAMKTTTEGYFYVPNAPISVLKVEMLFSDYGMEGDQAGKQVEGYPFSFPDGTVGLADLTLISGSYGRSEGESGWQYMADIAPPYKIVGLTEVVSLARNYGKNGTYITDLSGVTVSFNTGIEISPDDYGFVTIPQDATSFTVKGNDNPIGAMIIFW